MENSSITEVDNLNISLKRLNRIKDDIDVLLIELACKETSLRQEAVQIHKRMRTLQALGIENQQKISELKKQLSGKER